jgi:putative intracellular protease/amidase
MSLSTSTASLYMQLAESPDNKPRCKRSRVRNREIEVKESRENRPISQPRGEGPYARGGEPPLDPKSDTPEGRTELTGRFKKDPQAQAGNYDAVFYPRGHGPLWDLAEDATSSALIEAFYNAGKPVAAVCHGPAVLRHAKFNGEPPVKGKRATGFSTAQRQPNLGNLIGSINEPDRWHGSTCTA